jgi:hypothetical protein
MGIILWMKVMTQSEFNHLLDSINALSPEQLRQLRCELDNKLASSSAISQAALSEEELADQELQRRLFEAGLLSEIKPPRRVSTGTEQFTPIPIKGESLSETVIRERR